MTAKVGRRQAAARLCAYLAHSLPPFSGRRNDEANDEAILRRSRTTSVPAGRDQGELGAPVMQGWTVESIRLIRFQTDPMR